MWITSWCICHSSLTVMGLVRGELISISWPSPSIFGISLTITAGTTTKLTLSFPRVPVLSFGRAGLSGVFRGLVDSSWSETLVDISISLGPLGESVGEGINWYLGHPQLFALWCPLYLMYWIYGFVQSFCACPFREHLLHTNSFLQSFMICPNPWYLKHLFLTSSISTKASI